MSNVIDSLLVALGFQIDDSELKEFKSDVADARENLMLVVGAAAAAAAGIGAFVKSVADGIDELGDFAEVEQVSIEALQELGYAAQLNGSSIDAVKGSVSGLNRTIGEAVLGIGRGAATFEKLGMSAKNADGSIKSVDELLAEVSEKMQGLSRQEAIALAEKLGIDRSLVPLLMKGREELEKFREEARAFGLATEEDAAKAGALNDSFDRMMFMVGAISKSVAVGLMPRMTELLDGLREWVMSNRDVIKSSIAGTLQVITSVVGALWTAISTLVGWLGQAVRWLMQFELVTYAAAAALFALIAVQVGKGLQQLLTLIRGMAVGMATFSASALLVPLAIGAIALAIGLLIDDFMAWKEGGDSVIGDLIAQFPALEGVILTVEQAVRSFFGFLGTLWSLVGPPMGNLLGALWGLFTTIVSALWPVVRVFITTWAQMLSFIVPILAQIIAFVATVAAAIVGLMTNIVAGFVSGVTQLIQEGVKSVNWLVDIIVGAYNRIAGFIDRIIGMAGKVGELLGFGNASVTANVAQAPVAGGRGAAAARQGGVLGKAGDTRNSTSTVTNNTTVQAPITLVSSDPATAGKSVSKELNRVNQQATRNGQTAVAL